MRKLDAGNKRTTLVLSLKTRLALVTMCEAEGLTAAETVRNLIKAESEKRGEWKLLPSDVELVVATFEPPTEAQ